MGVIVNGVPKKAFVLLSGGLDSTTCLHKAIADLYTLGGDSLEEVTRRIQRNVESAKKDRLDLIDPFVGIEAISIDYGQRHIRETEMAKKTCEAHGITHSVIPLPGALSGEGVMLTDPSVEVPDISYSEIKGVSPTYVPFRNGTMLSLIAAHAQKWVNARINTLKSRGVESEVATQSLKDSAFIYYGAHAEDAENWAYPDCTPEFNGALANAIYTGTYYAVRMHTPLQWLKKYEIVKLGHSLGVPFEWTWSCYKGGEEHCGVCPTCRSRKEAFKLAGIEDPTVYAA